jgi:uncharacterized protein (TIGR02302 family)
MAPGLTALASLAALFLALALFDGTALIPGWLHVLILAGFASAALRVLIHLARLPKPTEDEAARRLERDSGVAHRPLAVLEDQAATGDAALWQAHRHRMESLAQSLRPGWPDPVLPARDPHALRFAALLLLVIAACGGGSDWPARLERAVTPALILPGLGPDMLEVWITPPAYTGLPPHMARPDQPLDIPEGSVVKAALSGGWGDATLRPGPDTVPFLRDPSGGQRAEAPMRSGDRLAVRQGWREVASWPVTVIRDALPSIAFLGQPESDPRGRLLLKAEASDDYGLAKVWLEIQRLEVPPGEPSLRVDLALPGERLKSTILTSRLDLAAHDWAGSPVLLIPHAEDGAGQSTSGEGTIVTLPERVFRHPVARALILWRREVSDAPRLGPDIAEELRQLLGQPEQFGGDAKVFLALALTRRILMANGFDRDEARDLLWSAATRLEDGAVPAAEQALEQARRELEKAIAENLPAPKLAELLSHVQAALEKWLSALAEAGASAPPPSPGDRVIGEEELAEMLGDLRDLAETGDREALRQKLSELSALLSQLGQAQTLPAGESKASQDMAALRDLARRQQDLLEQSFRHTGPLPEDEAPPPASASKPSAESRRQAQDQRALQNALAQLGKGMGEPLPSLDEAARAMLGAAEDLGRGDWPAAAEQQGEALRLLKDGARELVERMAAARGQGKPNGGTVARDPFGRSLQGQSHRDDGTTKITNPSDIRRAREILDELRRRAAQPSRPETERDYLRRLLKQF